MSKLRIIKYKLLSDAKNVIGTANFIQPCQLKGEGEIVFKKNITIGIDPSPFLYSGYAYIEARNNNSKILIDDNVMINNNIVIISDGEGITISKDVLIGTQCEIYDSDFHNLEIDKRLSGRGNTKAVYIEENVFIGSNVKILKGVRIGKNSVIANGSIVTKSIPENVIAGGNPAKIIKNL
ncbi:DapH/DapD/GlmU-related protein [Halarcobacter sp.]|uniref:DapH/DapD/GlmU-related protein n=1 Tax=Halarcobacter sp. TaxID=2321133 RepID=UPI002AAAB287|nr:DapH/DapD/GlmU-related protein [Halarcobacter sp.]